MIDLIIPIFLLAMNALTLWQWHRTIKALKASNDTTEKAIRIIEGYVKLNDELQAMIKRRL